MCVCVCEREHMYDFLNFFQHMSKKKEEAQALQNICKYFEFFFLSHNAGQSFRGGW